MPSAPADWTAICLPAAMGPTVPIKSFSIGPITKSDFEVGPMLKDLIGTVGPMAAGKQIAVQSAGADGIRVHADRLLIYQALINLVANAIKYSPAGTMVRIGVSDGNWGCLL